MLKNIHRPFVHVPDTGTICRRLESRSRFWNVVCAKDSTISWYMV